MPSACSGGELMRVHLVPFEVARRKTANKLERQAARGGKAALVTALRAEKARVLALKRRR